MISAASASISATTSWIRVRTIRFLSLASVVGADQTFLRSALSLIRSVADRGDGRGLEACRNAWNKLMQMLDRIASITQRTWAKPVTG
jgi:hypothetical protein